MIPDATGTSERTGEIARAPVRWRIRDVDHTETITVDPQLKFADRVDIWVDIDGNRVAAPTPRSQAAIDGLAVGIASWSRPMTVVGVCGFWCVRA